MPESLSTNNAELEALKKGELRFRWRGNLVASVWKDTKLNFLVPTESQVREANYGHQAEKMGSIPLTHSLQDYSTHDSNLTRVSAPLFLQLCWLRRFEVFVSHSLDSAALSHYISR